VRGWEVRRGRHLARTYRDPRWNSVTVCPSCAGSGSEGAQDCSTCRGTGTIRHALTTHPCPS
jgi:DnaJ-class molecular chaperone